MTLMVGWHENILYGNKVGSVDWIWLVHDRIEWGVPSDMVLTLQAM